MRDCCEILARAWVLSTRRMVPLVERMTSDWVWAPSGVWRTPCSRAPSVMPVATKKVLSLVTRSLVCRIWVRSCPASS